MGAADLISGIGGSMRPRLCTTVLFPVHVCLSLIRFRFSYLGGGGE